MTWCGRYGEDVSPDPTGHVQALASWLHTVCGKTDNPGCSAWSKKTPNVRFIQAWFTQ